MFGLNVDQFKILVRKISSLWEVAEEKRKNQPGRKREVGGGRKYKFNLDQLVAIVLFYYKTYMTQEVLGTLVGLDQSNVSRLLKKMLPIIEAAADPELASYLIEAKKALSKMRIENKTNSIDQIFQMFPDLREVYTDATEQSIFRSKNYDKQKKHYSGKTKQHAIKTQISVARSGKILDVSGSYPGSIHDKKIIDQENTINKFPDQTSHRLDSGYQGLADKHPNVHIILPYKKRKNLDLTPLAKDLNRGNSKRRVKVEHAISRVKKFKITSHQYRGDINDHNAIFRSIAALENFKMATQ